MYGYIRQGRRTALTRELIGGVAFQVLTVGTGPLRRVRARRLLRRLARQGVSAAEPPGQAALEQWLLARYGVAAGCGGQTPAVTVWCGMAGEERYGAAVYLGEDCTARQEVRYAVAGLGPWPVSEQLLAALFAAGRWEPSQIHVVSVTSRA